MLHLILGGFGSGKTELIYTEIAECVREGRETYLIVPEQYTAMSERALAERLPPAAPLTFEVTNFSRLANTVFRKKGGLAYRYATPATRRLLMWKTLTEAAAFLHESAETDVGRIEKTLASLSELRAAGIDDKALRTAAPALPEGERLRDRLLDLSLIGSIYYGLLTEQYSDAADDLDRLYETLRTQSPLANAAIYIDGFTSFTEQEYKILSALLLHNDVTVTLTLPRNADKSLAFSELFDTHTRLSAIAQRINTEKRETRLAGNRRARSKHLAFLSEHLFDVTPPACPDGCKEDILLIDAADTYAAADFVAADIRRRVMDGARYRDFAIVARNAESYIGILDDALEKCEIPYYMSTKVDISEYEIIKFIYAAYTLLAHGFREKDMISYVKCCPSDLCRDDRDLFALYVSTWRLHGRQAYAKPFTMHPKGYGMTLRPSDEARLSAINETREAILMPLFAFDAAQKEAVTVADHARALVAFLDATCAEDALLRRAKALHQSGQTREATHYARLYVVILDALDGLYDVLADTPVTAEVFLDLLKLAFRDAEIGHIPTAVDEVTVGSADMLRLDGVKQVYLFGVNEDEFPAHAAENSVFSDTERKLLSKLGLPLAPDLDIRSSRELFSFLRAFSAASDGVTLVSFRADSAFSPLLPSQAWDKIRLYTDAAPLTTEAMPPDSFLFAKEAAAKQLGRLSGSETGRACIAALPDTARFRRMAAMTEARVTEPTARLSGDCTDALYGNAFSLTQSKTDAYVQCPFLYLCRYELALSENEPAQLGFRDMGNYIHAVLEKLLLSVKASGRDIADLSQNEWTTLTKQAEADAERELIPEGTPKSPRLSHRLSVLARSASLFSEELRTEFIQSGFRPLVTELLIDERDKNALRPTVYTLSDGTRLSVKGKIDRVDGFAGDTRYFFRVVDYKTGAKDFSREDIEKGLNLQLLMYLFALCDEKNADLRARLGVPADRSVTPAGMLYMKTRTADMTADAPASPNEITARAMAEIERSGLLLDDDEALTAMEKEKKGRFIPYKEGARKNTSVLSEDDFAALRTDLEAAITRIGDNIRKGIADATPMQTKKGHGASCETCPMKPVCRNV